MKQVTIDLYTFDELSKDAQSEAIANLGSINVDYNWWKGVYEDAEHIGLIISSFDIDNHDIKGRFVSDNVDLVAHTILEEHGEQSNTVVSAKNYYFGMNGVKAQFTGFVRMSDREAAIEKVEKGFRNELLTDYLRDLTSEYRYRISDSQIIETIQANEYLFTINGDLFNESKYVQS